MSCSIGTEERDALTRSSRRLQMKKLCDPRPLSALLVAGVVDDRHGRGFLPQLRTRNNDGVISMSEALGVYNTLDRQRLQQRRRQW